MEIEVILRIPNRIFTSKYKKLDYMKSEGWNLRNHKRHLFSTTYSFTKII